MRAAAAGGAEARREVPAGHIHHGHRLGKLLPSQLCLRASAPARLIPSPRVQKTCEFDFGFGLDVPEGRTTTFGANVVESTLHLGFDAASDANQRQLHGGGKPGKRAKKKAKANVKRNPWKPGGNFRLPSDQVRATAQARPPACAGCHVCAPP